MNFDADTVLLARAVDNAVFQSLLNAQANPSEEEKWFKHADKLEKKFKTEHGVHYFFVLNPELRITYT